MILKNIENKLSRFTIKTVILLAIISLIGLVFRIYFTPWDLPSFAPDTFVYLSEGINYSNGNFSLFNARFVWPIILSFFFMFFDSKNYFEYLTIVRIVSICISALTIPIVFYITKNFVKKQYAYLSAIFFSFHPNIIENSTLGITESIFLLLGLLSFYFLIQKNEKYFLLSFVFAGLAFDTRLNGIVLIILIVIVIFWKFKNKKKLFKQLGIGIVIFIIIISPHLFSYVYSNSSVDRTLEVLDTPFQNKISPHLLSPTGTLDEEMIKSIESGEGINSTEIYKSAFVKEILHLIKISFPYLVFLAPFGFIFVLKNRIFETNILIFAIALSIIVAFPQYTLSAVDRNLFFIIPMLCILSSIFIQKITKNFELKNIFLIGLTFVIILGSVYSIELNSNVNIQLLNEQEKIAKIIVSDFEGRILGDNYPAISRNLIDLSNNPIIINTNEKSTLFSSRFALVTNESLDAYIYQNKIDYLVVDDEFNNRYPIFQKLYFYESKFPQFEKVLDSNELGYSEYKVKIFKTNRLEE